MDFLSVQSLN